MARKERQKALVVSSDRDIIRSATACGAATIRSDDFENKIVTALYANGNEISDDDADVGWKPTTRKKGPSRRQPKRQRRNKGKIRKL